MIARAFRLLGALAVLAGALFVGARRIGTAPALGPFLEPAHGVWSLARTANLPENASARIDSLGSDVRVVYDDRAVPHIFATTEEDVYRALGYVVARDRLFQMYVQTMAASGRLTELAGGRALELDREMRGLGLPRSAERAASGNDTATFMKYTLAYAQGVNAYIRGMSGSDLPLEFRLTGTTPVEWKLVDSYHLFSRMGWTLANINTESDLAAAASRVGVAAASALFPDAAPIQEPIQPNGQLAPRYDFHRLPPPGAGDSAALLRVSATDAFAPSLRVARANPDEEPRSMASNNWAVAPRRSANGHALLEGDPHLDLTLPSIWYEVHLVVPGKLDVYGVTIPGAPAVVIGFNRDVAWTFTNTGADVLDFYTETVDNPLHPTKYQVDGAWRKLEERLEKYRDTRGKVIATDTMYFTHRGPMRRVREKWLSMRWAVLEGGKETEALHGAAHAKTAAELEGAMGRSYFAPAQNMLSADRGGHIAIRSTGHFPMRPANGSGSTIRDGSTSASDWMGWLPLDRYPQSMDPAQGYLASANQQPIDPRTTKDWWGGSYDPWRALRIDALLRADSAMTPEKMRAFQTDPGSERANLFVPYFLAAARRFGSRPHPGLNTTGLAEAGRLLAEWDRRYTRENTRAVLFEEAMRELASRTWDELSADNSGRRRVATPASAVLAELLSDSTSVWWDDKVTMRVEQRDDILAASLVAALQTVRQRHGQPDSGGWVWSKVRFTNVNHGLRLAALGVQNIPVQGGPGLLNPSTGTGSHGSSWRMVVDLGPQVQAWATYPGGQSGNPFSARYKDRIGMWTRGELEPLRVPRAAGDLSSAQRSAELLLSPRR